MKQLRDAKNVGLSAAINELVRLGLDLPAGEKVFVQDISYFGETVVPIDNMAETLETIEGVDHP